ncbi:amino acid permease [Phenylobacterium sp.]|uniref:amino acid permease n=1 Tax=Phenylobacterium sp. TaxID=1871053 RepID=UPI003983C0FF
MSADAAPRGNRLFLRKSIEQVQRESETHGLKRTLGAMNLVLLGIGCIIGAGIYVMTGNAAANFAGPAVVLSFIVAFFACVFAGLCYAELASTMPVAGSAYTYSYTTLGELFAWVMGWLLVLEYGVAAATVAAGWSGNVVSLLANFGVLIPATLTTSYVQATAGADGLLTFVAGGGANILGALGILAVTGLLVLGVSESASVNNVIVFIKVGVLLLFIGFGIGFINIENWQPFVPANEGGFKYGVPGIFRAASVIFFAYVGFEAVSTAAAEAKNPQRDIPIGILGSLIVCTVIYMLVAAVLTGVVPFRELGVAAPIALAVDQMGITWFALLIKVGAVAGLTSVMLILTYGQSRVFYAMARDGLLPRFFATLHDKFRTPWIGTIVLGVIIAVTASLLPITILGDLVSLGTACAFGIVCLSVMYLRTTHPDLIRPFRVPLGGGYVTKPVMIVVAVVMAFLLLGFFRFLLESTWTTAGALVVVAGGLLWLAMTWRSRADRVWIGTAPLGGIFFAAVMAGPLIEDVFRKAATGDTIPAYILGGYGVVGALIYILYGYRNSRLGKGLPQIDDDQGAGPGPAQAIVHGLDDGHA